MSGAVGVVSPQDGLLQMGFKVIHLNTLGERIPHYRCVSCEKDKQLHRQHASAYSVCEYSKPSRVM
jgi:hypothetical protein